MLTPLAAPLSVTRELTSKRDVQKGRKISIEKCAQCHRFEGREAQGPKPVRSVWAEGGQTPNSPIQMARAEETAGERTLCRNMWRIPRSVPLEQKVIFAEQRRGKGHI